MGTTKHWVRVAKDPFGEENDDGYRMARIDVGTYESVASSKTQHSVLIAVRNREDEEPELSILAGPASKPEALGMDLSKGVTFHGDVALAVATLIGLAGGRLLPAGAGSAGLGGFAIVVEG